MKRGAEDTEERVLALMATCQWCRRGAAFRKGYLVACFTFPERHSRIPMSGMCKVNAQSRKVVQRRKSFLSLSTMFSNGRGMELCHECPCTTQSCKSSRPGVESLPCRKDMTSKVSDDAGETTLVWCSLRGTSVSRRQHVEINENPVH